MFHTFPYVCNLSLNKLMFINLRMKIEKTQVFVVVSDIKRKTNTAKKFTN